MNNTIFQKSIIALGISILIFSIQVLACDALISCDKLPNSVVNNTVFGSTINPNQVGPDTSINPYPQDFRSPLGIPLILSGTFAELRNNHFHGGIDIKTQAKEKLHIYSIEDGYVSRIKVSPRGYGNALYITHPNGYTSVYAHLRSFNAKIDTYLKAEQYQNQSWEFDEQIPIGVLQVTKGEIVALSGNSGSSNAPHLHFEIRDSYTEVPINPLLFGYDLKDTRKPLINLAAVYPMDKYDRSERPKLHKIKALGSGEHTLYTDLVKVNSTRVGVGIKTYDKLNDAENLNGVYSLDVFDNGIPIYGFKMEKVPFEETRFLNAHVDYRYKKEGKGWLQKCFVDPGNHLSIYNTLVDRGIINLGDGLIHKVVCVVKDVAGNQSRLSFSLQYDPTLPYTEKNNSYTAFFGYNMDNRFDNGSVQLDMPYGSLYEDLELKYTNGESTRKDVFSLYHTIHEYKVPVHTYFNIAIKPLNLPAHLYEKAVVGYRPTKSGSFRSLGGEWEGNFLKARSREFGQYCITVDTIAPVIKQVTIYNGKAMNKNQTITLKISDNLSGIKSYNGYIDGQWVLMSYDSKSNRVKYYFDDKISKGKHQFELVVVDGRNNTKTYKASFTR